MKKETKEFIHDLIDITSLLFIIFTFLVLILL